MFLRSLLVDPATYFERPRNCSVLRAGLVVGAVAVLTAVLTVVALLVLVTRLESQSPAIWSAFWQVVPVMAVAIVFGTLFAWGLYGVGLFVLAKLVGGDGSFGATVAVGGLGMAPMLVQIPLAGVVLLVQFGSLEPTADPQVLAQQVQALTGGGSSLVTTLLQVGATVWGAFIWTYGLRATHDLDVETAAVPAALLALVDVVMNLV